MARDPAKILARLKRVTDQVHGYLNTRLASDAVDFARLYRHHRDRLVSRLQEIYDAYLWDDPTLVRARASGALPELEEAITRAVDSLATQVGRASVDRITTLLDVQPAVVRQATKQVLPVPPARTPPPEVLGELTTNVVGGGTYFDRLFHGSQQLQQKLHQDVTTGLLNGQTFDEVRARVMKSFGVDKLVAPQGSAYGSVKHYTNEARRQWNRLMGQTAKDHGALEVWWAILEGPLASTTTPGCAARHGRPIHVIGVYPPMHINCRCTVAVLPAETDLAPFLVDADRWLKQHGYSRKEASLEEADADA